MYKRSMLKKSWARAPRFCISAPPASVCEAMHVIYVRSRHQTFMTSLMTPLISHFTQIFFLSVLPTTIDWSRYSVTNTALSSYINIIVIWLEAWLIDQRYRLRQSCGSWLETEGPHETEGRCVSWARHIYPTGSTQEEPSLQNWKIVDGTERIKSNVGLFKHEAMEKWNAYKSLTVFVRHCISRVFCVRQA